MDTPAPKVANTHLPILLYVVDAVLFSLSFVGMKWALTTLATYCNEDQLIIDYDKSKVLVFSNKRQKYKWTIDSHELEQVKSF